MLEKGYIKRAPDPDDRRQSKLNIAPSGRKLHKKVAAQMTLRQNKILTALSANERKTLEKLLLKTALHAALDYS